MINTYIVYVTKKKNNFRDKISEKELKSIEEKAIPGPGSCGGMYTANTMASAVEALGMSLPGSSSQAAISKDKNLDCINSGKAMKNLLEKRSIKDFPRTKF